MVLLVVDEAEAAARIGHGRDRLEKAGASFHRAVTDGFRDLAAADPARWVTVDGGGTVAEVEARVRAVVGVAPRSARVRR